MKSSSQNRKNNKTANKRTIATALLICFISVSILSGAFVLAHTDHKHERDGIGDLCVICVQIQNAEDILKLLGAAVALGFVFLAGYRMAIIPVREVYYDITVPTPISAKTRMNN